MFLNKYKEKNQEIMNIVAFMSSVSISDTIVPMSLQLGNNSSYIAAIQTLQQLPGFQAVNQKQACLSNTVNCILSEIKQANGGNLPQIHLEDFLSLFTYVLIKAQIPALYSEIMFIKAFTLAPFTLNQEGFLICNIFLCPKTNLPAVMEACLSLIPNLPRMSSFDVQAANFSNNNGPFEDDDVPPPYPGPDFVGEMSQQQPGYHATIRYSGTTNDNVPLPMLPNDNNSRFDTLFRAEKGFITSIKQAAPTFEGHMYLCNYYQQKGKLSKAIEQCSKALVLKPDNEEALNLMTLCLASKASLSLTLNKNAKT